MFTVILELGRLEEVEENEGKKGEKAYEPITFSFTKIGARFVLERYKKHVKMVEEYEI